MFGEIKVPLSGLEVDVDVLTDHIVGMALIHREEREYHMFTAIRAQGEGDWDLRDIAVRLAREADRLMASVTCPLRLAIGHRTRQERVQAEATVRAGGAAFLEVACAGETCADCERPLWHHIRTTDALIHCPVGREYWALARALVANMGNDDAFKHANLLAIIAARD